MGLPPSTPLSFPSLRLVDVDYAPLRFLISLSTSTSPQKINQVNEMMSLKSFVILALLASVSANRDLLQGEFSFDFFQFFWMQRRRRVFCGWGHLRGDSTSAFRNIPDLAPPWRLIDVIFRLSGREDLGNYRKGRQLA